MELLLPIAIILVATKIVGHLANRLGMPAVVGELLTGVLVGPAVLNWVQPTEMLIGFADIGVILLMFMAGLESDLGLLRKYLKPSVSVASFGVIIPILLCSLVGVLFAFPLGNALFLGVLFGATSLSITVQVLKEYKKMNSQEGATILGAAVLDDILVVVMLNIVIGIFDDNSNTSLGLLLLKKALFFVATFILYKWVVPYLMKLADKLVIQEAVVGMALSICFLFAYFADFMGMAGIIGAFFAGIAVSQTSAKKVIDEKIEPIGYALFVPVFFVSIGLNMSFIGLQNHIWFIVVLTIVAILSKLLGGGLGAKLTGSGWLSATMIGAGLVSRGEMALIIAKMGLDSSLLANEYFTSIVMVVILTALIAPFILKYTIFKQQNKNN